MARQPPINQWPSNGDLSLTVDEIAEIRALLIRERSKGISVEERRARIRKLAEELGASRS